ncbi:MAG: pilus assembly protein TadG-related protein [Pseudomonadota bacterium]
MRKNKEVYQRSENGSAAIMIALLLAVLLGFVAMVVDVGNLFRVRNELQNAADSAALAGARMLDGTQTGIVNARAGAHSFALQNNADNTAVAILPEDLIFGRWHFVANTFCSPAPCFEEFGINPTTAVLGSVSAVRVRARRSALNNSPVMSFFASVINITQSNVAAEATAVGGGPSRECGFPMVVSDCALATQIAPGLCQYCMRFQDNNSDNAGWTTFSPQGQVSGPEIARLIKNMCYDAGGNVAVDPSTGECVGEISCENLADVGDSIQVQNGNLLNTGANNFCPVIKRILLRGDDPNATPQPFVVKVPVLESVTQNCDGSQFSGTHNIAGYAAMVIYGAKCGNNDAGVYVPQAPACNSGSWPPPSGKWIVAALSCDLGSTQPAGGGFFGMDARLRLVK